MPTVLITGGTGLVGTSLTALLTEKGYSVVVLTRSRRNSNDPKISYATWNVEEQQIDKNAIATADYIVHLAGAGVADKRWTTARKKEIVESRTLSSKLIVKALAETPNNVKAVVSASAIGWYGDDKQRKGSLKGFTEDEPADDEFLGSTCRLWEESITPVVELGKRLVKFRIGIVLSKDGGALAEFIKPLRFGVAAVLGSGRQVISWIHIEDIARLFLYAIESNHVTGVYNAVAPAPVTNKELTITLARKINGAFYIPMPVPAFVLKLMLGEVSIEVLKSATVSSDKIVAAGFTFQYPTIDTALSHLSK